LAGVAAASVIYQEMNRELAKELKAAGFPIRVYRVGHRFFPHEKSPGWSDSSREHGVTLTNYALQNRLQDIKDGYYCPSLSDLIEACGDGLARLFIEKDIWTAESKNAEKHAVAHSAEEAVAALWFALRKQKSL
jgi:hypothetical protein